MTNNQVKWLFAFAVASIFLSQFAKFMVNSPRFLDTVIEDYKAQDKLMSKIGGYSSYSFRYSASDIATGDTTLFHLEVIGYENSICVDVHAVKTVSRGWTNLQLNDEWEIIKEVEVKCKD